MQDKLCMADTLLGVSQTSCKQLSEPVWFQLSASPDTPVILLPCACATFVSLSERKGFSTVSLNAFEEHQK